MGHDVVVFVRPTSDVDDLTRIGATCQVVDIKDRRAVREHVKDFEYIFHLAAAFRTEHSDLDEFWQVNAGATRNLLEAAQESGVDRFIHCSTVGVQGDIEDPPADETYRMKPGDHYQKTKAEGERIARKHFAAGLPGVVVRPAGIYGPGDRRFLKLFRAINHRSFPMVGKGEALYHLTYIDDLIDGFIRAARRDEALGEIFTIAGPQYTTIRQLVDLIADVLEKPKPKLRIPFAPVYAASVVCDKLCRSVGVSPPLYPRRLDFFWKDRAFSIDKARRILDYEPKVDLKEGLTRTAEWYKQQGWLR
jgi:nucleoside-diphosphate-sugar epimerase